MFSIGRVLVAATGVMFLAVFATYWLATGPRHLEQYPLADTSPYRLPWRTGEAHLCIQGNRAIVSHRGWDEFAYDFTMPEGTAICAARSGTVIGVVQEHDGNGYHWPNNWVALRHEDGTLGYYLHIQKQGSRVKQGDFVAQGQVIAASGNVGNSMLPHLHFHVTDADRKHTLPITFSDVRQDAGIPRMFKQYVSGDNLERKTSANAQP